MFSIYMRFFFVLQGLQTETFLRTFAAGLGQKAQRILWFKMIEKIVTTPMI